MKLKAHYEEITSPNSLYLHQCKQCGVIFERGTSKPVFSSNNKFMVDKCDNCKYLDRSFTKYIE